MPILHVTEMYFLYLGTDYDNDLAKAKVSVIGNRQCTCLYGSFITDDWMCSKVSTNTCSVISSPNPYFWQNSLLTLKCYIYISGSAQNSVGGPLVIKPGDRWIQAGIFEGIDCSGDNAFYARVSQYQNWINEQITSNQPGFISFTSTGPDRDLSVSCSAVPPIPTPTPVNFTTAALGKATFIYHRCSDTEYI